MKQDQHENESRQKAKDIRLRARQPTRLHPIMEKKMETTIVYWGYVGDNGKMEATFRV